MEQDVNSDTAAEGYMAAYGLRCEPFGDVISPSFFYPGATREQRLNLLLHLIPLGEILLITGVPGVGKSTLLDQFLGRAHESWRVCHLDGDVGLDANVLLQQLVQTFVPEVREQADHSEQERLLIAQLQALRNHAQTPMLLIDNAHNISESGLRTLSKFMAPGTDESKLFGIVLFSEASIEEKLNNPALQSLHAQIKHTFELDLLNEAETLQYLDHRMRAAGLMGDGPFTAAVNSAIFGASKGLPVKINELALAILHNKNYTTPPASVGVVIDDTTDPNPANNKRTSMLRLWPFVVAAALASVLLFQDEINALFTSSAENSQDVDSQATKQSPLEMTTITPLELPPDSQGSISRAASAGLEPMEEAVVESPPELPSAPEGAVEDQVDFTNEVVGEVLTEVLVEPIMQEEKMPLVAVDLPVVPEPAVEKEGATIAEPAGEDVSSPLIEQTDGARGEWVMAQHLQAYTLQLVAQQQRQQREDFLIRFGLENEVERFSTDKNGQRWYVAASGVYGTRTEALEASRQLPEGIVPWARSFASIQKELWGATPTTEDVAATAPAAVIPVTVSEQERWVLARPPEHYLLQLVAFKKEANTRDFVVSHALGGVAKQVRIMNQGQIWYVALYGDAADRADADEMVENLIKSNGIPRPWVRTYGSLQAAMRALQPQ